MGLEIERDRFEGADYANFAERLEHSLVALAHLLDRRDFGVGPISLGAELELFLVDDAGNPLLENAAVLSETVDPRMTVELDRFNLECNLRHGPLEGAPLSALEDEMSGALAEVRRAAGLHGARPVAIGILPTLRAEDFRPEVMTDSARFRALSGGLRRLRRSPFRIRISGEDLLEVACHDVTFEGANTSLQIHLRVSPGDFTAVFNAIQMATPPSLAVACNSPTFLGHRLWDETRVALFKQAVDDRGGSGIDRGREARVSLGSRWIRDGALELFSEGIALYEPLLPILSDEDPLACLGEDRLPKLEEVRLHQGTIWRWNRPIYDPTEGGHLRVEMRALPAGPTIADMAANVAFHVGLALGLAEEIAAWTSGLPFELFEHDFYRAAQRGLDAELVWPPAPGEPPRPIRARDLVLEMLPVAQRGLDRAGVDATESRRALAVIEERARSGRTGARWQREALARSERARERPEAVRAMFRSYLARADEGGPVHTWELPEE